MTRQGFTDELERALDRRDAEQLVGQVKDYAAYFANGMGEWSDEQAATFGEILDASFDEPDKALAYVVLAAAHIDDADFLNFMGCGPLEDILRDPSPELLDRIVAEARKSARFRWMLSSPFKIAIAPRAWHAIAKFRITGEHEEPSGHLLPPR